MKESQTIEFKRCITENLKYEVIAFANTAGGTIYIGKGFAHRFSQ